METNIAANAVAFGGNIEIVATADVNGDGVADLIGVDFQRLMPIQVPQRS